MKRYLTNPTTSKDSQKKIKPPANRKYDAAYLQLGFIVKPGTENIDNPIPQCVVCSETLSNQSMKPSLLKQHQTTKHPDLVDKPIKFFERKSELYKKLVKASYLANYRIAKEGKPHTISETLLLPVAKDMVEAVLGEKAVKEIEKIPLANDTVKRRIVEMSSSIEEQLLLQLRECNYFALQVDESTDKKYGAASCIHTLNILNMGLQGPSTTVFTTNDKISSFKKKLVLFCSQAQDKDFSAFPTLASFLKENDISLKPEVTDDITSHMEALQTSFDNYFHQDFSKYEWIRNPFSGKFPSH
ncbi:hypothetical protein RN001_014304 [Aquatica leii]|uniref:DUF4371 domain-containing protein n=1 Tax=Aquatica leii TaxID=1421715 RepID=A0AAN7P1E1_9COLE|nr:hypothetical protein RN001_014304 [Aquatica leii]